MQMSLFEAGMLICFGASWPVAVYKTWRTKESGGKSRAFLALVLLGYFSGITHKVLYALDPVIALYILNAAFVLVDLVLVCRLRRAEAPELT